MKPVTNRLQSEKQKRRRSEYVQIYAYLFPVAYYEKLQWSRAEKDQENEKSTEIDGRWQSMRMWIWKERNEGNEEGRIGLEVVYLFCLADENSLEIVEKHRRVLNGREWD